LTGETLGLTNTDKEALEKNIFGVDINEESVEIAKLSLWLRTARQDRPLSFLSDNIKVGNSLIDNPEIAGEKAFDWNKEFPEIMQKGGFDIVIGNPPYYNIQTLGKNSKIANFIKNQYQEIWQDKSDIIFYFIFKALQLSKNKVSFIISNAFLFSDKAQKLRNYILENASIRKIINFEQLMVFKDASITTAIIDIEKNKSNEMTLAYAFKDKKYEDTKYIFDLMSNEENYMTLKLEKNEVFALIKNQIHKLNKKIDGNYSKLGELLKVGKGMETAANDVFLFEEYPLHIPKKFIKKRLSGEIIERYEI